MSQQLPAQSYPEQPGWSQAPFVEVGDFEQGSPVSRWALARYLVGRAVGESLGRSLLVIGLLLLAVAAVSGTALHSTAIAVLVALVALGVLAMRAVLRAVLGRLTAARDVAPYERRLRALVADTRADVLRELRRVGLPGRTITLPLLAWRLLRRRHRATTVARLRRFDLDRAVPRTRLDELHLVLTGVLGRPERLHG